MNWLRSEDLKEEKNVTAPDIDYSRLIELWRRPNACFPAEIATFKTLSYSSPAVCIAREFSAISNFVMAAPISGCSPILCCRALRIS